MRKRLIVSYLLLSMALSTIVGGQTRRDPRAVAMGGAYGSVSRGIFCIDYNPANLAIENQYKSYRVWTGVDMSLSSNFLSLNAYKKYNGKNMEASDGVLKQEFLDEIPSDGWRFFTDAHFVLPFVNYSFDNKAITSDLIAIGDLGLPRGLVRFIFNGNPIGENLDIKFSEEVLVMSQWSYSMAFPVKDFFLGFTFKYLQGIGYIGLNPDSSYGYINTYFEPGKDYINGEAKYLFQQSLGGRGFAMDLGFSTNEIDGYRFGLSLTNLFGRIYWGKKTMFSRIADPEKILPWNGKYFEYEFQINEVSFDKFFKEDAYKKLFPGKGKSIDDSTKFSTSYPTLARFSVSKQFDETTLVSSDFVTGFEDRLFAFGAWKWCVGAEITRSPKWPIRVGVSLGGRDHREISFGSGYHTGFLHLDWAIGLNHGLWITSAKGLNFSFSVYTTGKRK